MPRQKTAALTAVAKKDEYVEIGQTGLNRWGGQIADEFLRELSGSRGRAVYREMSDNDPIIGACLGTIGQHLRDVSVVVTPAVEDDARAQEYADFVTGCLADMSTTWSDVLSEILSMLVYGWSAMEIVYKRRRGTGATPPSAYTDGRVGWRKLAPRAQDSLDEWIFDETGGVQAFQQRPAPSYQLLTIPIEKLLLFRTESKKNNPEGSSLLRRAYVPYYYAKRIRQIEGIGIERDLAGLPVVRVPSSVIAKGGTALAAYKDLVTNVRRDEQEGIVLPSDRDASGNPLYELSLLSTGGKRNFDTSQIIGRYQKDIAVSLFADFVLMGHEKVGSYALADVKSGVFAVALGGWMDAICAVFSRHAIPRLMALNGWPAELSPKMTHGSIGNIDLAAIGQYVTALAGAGFDLLMVPELQDHLLKLAELPTLEVEEVGS